MQFFKNTCVFKIASVFIMNSDLEHLGEILIKFKLITKRFCKLQKCKEKKYEPSLALCMSEEY